MKKRVYLITILTIANAFTIFPTDNQQNCSYSIQIETTCAPSADTTDHISLRFGDSAGNSVLVKHLKNPKLLYAPKGHKNQGGSYNGFGICEVDMFEERGACMTQWVCSLYLKQVGPDGWRPGWVKVLHQEDGGGQTTPVSYVFYFRTFLPGNVWYGFDYCHSRGRGELMPHVASFDVED